MLKTSARLLRLLSLLQARRFWPGAELAERLDVTERTVRRDVDRLRTLGYPVNASSGVAGGYRLGAGASLPPLLLDDDEALAVALGLRSAATGTVTGMEEAAVRALAKLDQVLPARLRRHVKELHAAMVPLRFGEAAVDAGRLIAIAGACRNNETLSFDYADGRGQKSTRSVEPHGLVHTAARWYLAAFDLGRDDWRTFRVDRLTSELTVGRRFTPRPVPYGGLAEYVSRSLGAEAYPERVRVILHAPYEQVAARVGAGAGHLERIDDARCLLETGGHDRSLVSLYVAMVGVDFEVLDPPELVDELRALSARFARAADRSRPGGAATSATREP